MGRKGNGGRPPATGHQPFLAYPFSRRATPLHNPHDHEVENLRVRVRCPECRTTFHERLNRVIHADRVSCPTCRNEMHFHGIGHIHEHETVADFIHHVEEHTSRPHFSLRR